MGFCSEYRHSQYLALPGLPLIVDSETKLPENLILLVRQIKMSSEVAWITYSVHVHTTPDFTGELKGRRTGTEGIGDV